MMEKLILDGYYTIYTQSELYVRTYKFCHVNRAPNNLLGTLDLADIYAMHEHKKQFYKNMVGE